MALVVAKKDLAKQYVVVMINTSSLAWEWLATENPNNVLSQPA